jgi:hypothetical protein
MLVLPIVPWLIKNRLHHRPLKGLSRMMMALHHLVHGVLARHAALLHRFLKMEMMDPRRRLHKATMDRTDLPRRHKVMMDPMDPLHLLLRVAKDPHHLLHKVTMDPMHPMDLPHHHHKVETDQRDPHLLPRAKTPI